MGTRLAHTCSHAMALSGTHNHLSHPGTWRGHCLTCSYSSPPPQTPLLRSSTKPGSFTLCLKRALNFSFLNAGMLLSSSFAQTPWWRWMGARNTVIRKIKLGLVIFLYHGAVSPTSDVLHSARMSPEPLVPVVKKTIKNTIGERVMMKFNCSRSHTWGLLAVEPGGSAASSFTAVSLSRSLRSFH